MRKMLGFMVLFIIAVIAIVVVPASAGAMNSDQHPGQFPHSSANLYRWVNGAFGQTVAWLNIPSVGTYTSVSITDQVRPNPSWVYIDAPQLGRLVNTAQKIEGEQKGYLSVGISYYDLDAGEYRWWESWIPTSALKFSAGHRNFHMDITIDQGDLQGILEQSDFYGNWLPWYIREEVWNTTWQFFGPSYGDTMRGIFHFIYKDKLPN